MFLPKRDPFQLAPGCSNSATTTLEWPRLPAPASFLEEDSQTTPHLLAIYIFQQVEDPTINALIMPIWFARRETGASKLEPCTTFLWNSTKLHDLLLLQGDPVEKTRKTSCEMLQGDAVSVVSLLCTGHQSISIHFRVSGSQRLEDTLTFVRPAFDEVICSGERVFAAEANALVHLPTTPSFVSYWW